MQKKFNTNTFGKLSEKTLSNSDIQKHIY